MHLHKIVRLWLALCLGIITTVLLLPGAALAVNLLTNGGFNNPFYNSDREWNGQDEKIATGWNYFYIADNTYRSSQNASKLHWMSSAQFASLPFGGLDYHIEGDASQMLWSSYEFDAGVYQQVSGLTPGNAYKFFIKMATYWRGPGYPDTNGVMVKQVGIDPYGGIDPTSENIIWSNTDSDDKAWVGLEAAATAETSIITVFAKVYAPENDSSNHTDLDMVYFEDSSFGYLMAGATTTLNASTSGKTVNLTWSTGAAGVMGYEVQYKDQAVGNWISLQDKDNQSTSGSFTGEGGHSYTIRARTWQTDGSLNLPGRWAEKTDILVGDVVMGRVMNYGGFGLNGVTVSVSGTVTSTVSANDGRYLLDTPAGTFDVVANDFDGLVAPPAGQVTVPANGVGTLDIVLRPTGNKQGLTNNDLDTDLTNWNVSNGTAAGITTTQRHSGNGSLHLSNTVAVSQTGAVTGMLNPLLSFWYKSDTALTAELLGNPNDLSAESAGLEVVQSRVLATTGDSWQHVILDWGTTGVYTGEIGVNFNNSGAGSNIFIDEVSIAAGFYKTFLPIVMKD